MEAALQKRLTGHVLGRERVISDIEGRFYIFPRTFTASGRVRLSGYIWGSSGWTGSWMSAYGICLSNLPGEGRGISGVPASNGNECDAPEQYRYDTEMLDEESGISERIFGWLFIRG